MQRGVASGVAAWKLPCGLMFNRGLWDQCNATPSVNICGKKSGAVGGWRAQGTLGGQHIAAGVLLASRWQVQFWGPLYESWRVAHRLQ